MIAMINHNGNMARFSVDHDIALEKVDYRIYCQGRTIHFSDFTMAARAYKRLVRVIEEGCNALDVVKRLVSAAEMFGLKVEGVA